MNSKKCPSCGELMKRNGRTKAGAQRWRCRSCGSSASHRHDGDAKALRSFVSWLLSKGTQADMPGGGRTFRRRTARFWEIWPMPDVVDEVHRVVFVDGIWIARDCVVLIACSDEFVLSWHLARSETRRAWQSLLSRIAPPDMVVADGGSGFAAAVAEEWPQTRVQRCTFHTFCQVRRYTTSRPRLQAGIELYGLACELLHVEDLRGFRPFVLAVITIEYMPADAAAPRGVSLNRKFLRPITNGLMPPSARLLLSGSWPVRRRRPLSSGHGRRPYDCVSIVHCEDLSANAVWPLLVRRHCCRPNPQICIQEGLPASYVLPISSCFGRKMGFGLGWVARVVRRGSAVGDGLSCEGLAAARHDACLMR